MWRLGSQEKLRHVFGEGRSILPPGRVCSANALGIIDSNHSGNRRTRLQKCRQWKPPILILDQANGCKRDTLPTHNSQSAEKNGFMWVEIERKIGSGAGYAGQLQVLAWMLVSW